MTSKVSISNLALASLGEKSFIQSLTEASVQAKYANIFYDQARRATLRVHPWNCARIRNTLAELSDEAVGKWQYTYALPTNCLKVRFIESYSASTKIPFEVALNEAGTTRILYTNQAEAVLVYTADVEDPNLFDPLFVDALALNLAFRMAPTLAPSKSQEMASRYVASMRSAQAVDGGEGQPDEPAAPDWLEARITGSGADLYELRRSLTT